MLKIFQVYFYFYKTLEQFSKTIIENGFRNHLPNKSYIFVNIIIVICF